MKAATLVIALALAGCITTPAKPFVCSTTDPDTCALERRIYDLEQRQRRQEQRADDREACEFVFGPDPYLC